MPKQAIVAYVPVLHAGYKRLFDAYPDADIYVFSAKEILRFDNLRKDLRALKPEEVVSAITGWGRSAKALNQSITSYLQRANTDLILPDEDVSHALADALFTKNKKVFSTIFLRWDRRRMEAEKDPVNPDRTISEEEFDREMLARSIILGRKSSNLYRRMGAIIVKNGEVIMEAHNSSYPTPHTSWIDGDPRNNANRGTSMDITTDIHAEARSIAEAAQQGVALKGTSMYVLDFPCPTCAKLIASSGIAKVYYGKGYAVLDGEQALNAAQVELIHVVAEQVDDDFDGWVPYPEKKQ